MEEVTVVKKGRVLEILLNRPKVNAIDLATSRKLGDAFGNPECIRISYAASEEQIEEALKRIKSVLTE